MTELLPWWSVVPLLSVLGAGVGSFLSVIVWRVPRGMRVVRSPSVCTSCDHVIAWYDGIPLVSYLVLRGACRSCGAHISLRYPLVELACAAAFAVLGGGVYAGYYPAALLPALLYWAAIGLALTLIDLGHHRLPNVIVLPSYVVTAVLLVLASAGTDSYGRLWTATIGCLALFGFYWLLAMASPGGMGFGDVKLAGALGMLLGWLGWTPLIVGAVSAFVLGGLVGVSLMIARRATRTSRIPFGPFMLAGTCVGVASGAGLMTL